MVGLRKSWCLPTGARVGGKLRSTCRFRAKALTRFRTAWRWDGQPVVLQSRAWDEAGNIQPTRDEMFAERGAPKVNVPVTAFPMGHMNVITSWAIDAKGEIKHVYA
jgi:sulfane dehydrogenase subunit SoxC